MERHTFVSFEWNEPDEGEFDAAGNVVQPGGRGILEHLHNALNTRGMQVSAVDLHEDYGWSMDVVVGGVSVWCMIQFSEPWLIITDVPFQLWHGLLGRKPSTQQFNVCVALHDALLSSGQAKSVQWFSSHQYSANKGQGGSNHP